jgi:RsiW-degrading membrane proteinase PrsW (M82 family)
MIPSRLQPGPGFVWPQLAVGAATLLAALAGFFVLRRARVKQPLRRLAAQAALGLVLVLAAAAIVRSFRVL